MPARKTKCKACGQFMHVKSTPENREKRLMTEAQAEAAEQAWAARSDRQQAEQLAAATGIQPQASVAASKPALMALAANSSADKQQRKMAALSLIRLAATHEECESWSALGYAMDLELMQAGGVVPQVMIRSEAARCAVCARLDRQVLGIEQALAQMPLPPRDCPQLIDGNPCLCWYRAVNPAWHGSNSMETAMSDKQSKPTFAESTQRTGQAITAFGLQTMKLGCGLLLLALGLMLLYAML